MSKSKDPPATKISTPVRFGAGLSSRARGRLAVGVLFVVVGVLVNVAVYRGMNSRSPVVLLVRDVPAGQRLVVEDFGVAQIGADGSFRSVPNSDVVSVVGSYAKVRLIAGSLFVREALQPGPLVAPGASVVAVIVGSGEVPAGLRERSRVSVVMVNGDHVTRSVSGVVSGLPKPGASAGQMSISVELSVLDAVAVASSDKVRLVLLDPAAGP